MASDRERIAIAMIEHSLKVGNAMQGSVDVALYCIAAAKAEGAAAEREKMLAGGTVPEEIHEALDREVCDECIGVARGIAEQAAALAEKRALLGMADKWFDAYQAAGAISAGVADFRWAEGRVPAAQWVELLDMLSGQGAECERRAAAQWVELLDMLSGQGAECERRAQEVRDAE